MRIFDRSGTRFMEFELRGDKFVLTGQGAVNRYGQNRWVSRSKMPIKSKVHLATEGPLIHDGSQTVLASTLDARNSTLTGTTLAGPNGSGQFLVMTISTVNTARTVTFASTLAGANFPNAIAYGVLQNKPRGGEAADIGIFGISKVVVGSTSIVAGTQLGVSSTVSGVVVPVSSGVTGQRMGIALEAPTAVGQVITAALYGFLGGGGAAGTP